MKPMTIIPAIDLIDGKCVRLTRGDYGQTKVYGEDPLAVARSFERAGATRLHLVDLDGAKASGPVNLAVLRRIAAGTDLEIEFGGGIKSEAALQAVFDAGAAFAICGSVAVTDPDGFSCWLDRFGGRIILGADLRDGCVATRGWLDTSAVTAVDLLSRFNGRLGQAIVTEIARDGMLSGVDIPFYQSLQEAFPSIDIIVSGGISCAGDLLACRQAGLRGVIVGKALYEGRIGLDQLFRGGNEGC